jgi:hypothetical protein
MKAVFGFINITQTMCIIKVVFNFITKLPLLNWVFSINTAVNSLIYNNRRKNNYLHFNKF